jgi:hypothetical protein
MPAVFLMLLLTPAASAIDLQSYSPCTQTCVEVIDYQDTRSPLMFSRSITASGTRAPGQNAQWRHRYEIRLTQDGRDRVLFDSRGVAHRFIEQADGRFLADDDLPGVNGRSGRLERFQEGYRWIDGDTIEYRFQGSFPVTVHRADGQSLRLHYKAGQLNSIEDAAGQRIEIETASTSMRRVSFPDGRSMTYRSDACEPAELSDADDEPEYCDRDRHPVAGFPPVEHRPWVSAVDARPASCGSYFVDYYGTERGAQIEAGLSRLPPYSGMLATSRSYPVIDFIDAEELVVIRSRDLASASLNDPQEPEALFDSLMQDARLITTRFIGPLRNSGVLSVTEGGRTTQIMDEGQQIVMHLLVRQHMASPAHWAQIEAARLRLSRDYGFRLQVVMIP